MVQVIKGIAATIGSYALAVYVLDSQIPSFAPFAALLVVQVTVYQSVLHAVRYVAAVVVGLVCAGAIGLTLGEHMLALAVLVSITLIIGQWPRLRGLGPQVAIVGIFTFAAGGGDDPGYLLSLFTTVLCGALLGAATNLLLAPPIRFHDAAVAVEDVSSSAADLLDEIAGELRSDTPLDDVDAWREHAERLSDTVQRSRNEIDYSAENSRLNPRRLAHRQRPVFTDYRDAADTLGRVVGEMQGITLALNYARRYGEAGTDGHLLGDFLPRYADLIDESANALRSFGAYHTGAGLPERSLSDQIDSALQMHDDLTDQLREAQPRDARSIADCGALLVEAERLLSHLRDSDSSLAQETHASE
ncbi:FUSC family protein [Phytoactinopolyspora mesophila]|nr:aromatic acid exporter family protein [Phytoactinopolyspora mesophila]